MMINQETGAIAGPGLCDVADGRNGRNPQARREEESRWKPLEGRQLLKCGHTVTGVSLLRHQPTPSSDTPNTCRFGPRLAHARRCVPGCVDSCAALKFRIRASAALVQTIKAVALPWREESQPVTPPAWPGSVVEWPHEKPLHHIPSCISRITRKAPVEAPVPGIGARSTSPAALGTQIVLDSIYQG